jgi:hypothetical protein
MVFGPNRAAGSPPVLAGYVPAKPARPLGPLPSATPTGKPAQTGLHAFLPVGQTRFQGVRFPGTAVSQRNCAGDGRCTLHHRRLTMLAMAGAADGSVWLAYVVHDSTNRGRRAYRRLRNIPYFKVEGTWQRSELWLVRIVPQASQPPRIDLRWRVPRTSFSPSGNVGSLSLALSGHTLHLAATTYAAGRSAIRYLQLDTRRLPRLAFPKGEQPVFLAPPGAPLETMPGKNQ